LRTLPNPGNRRAGRRPRRRTAQWYPTARPHVTQEVPGEPRGSRRPPCLLLMISGRPASRQCAEASGSHDHRYDLASGAPHEARGSRRVSGRSGNPAGARKGGCYWRAGLAIRFGRRRAEELERSTRPARGRPQRRLVASEGVCLGRGTPKMKEVNALLRRWYGLRWESRSLPGFFFVRRLSEISRALVPHLIDSGDSLDQTLNKCCHVT